ncbi:MarR family transcriptional regulator [Roseicyclus sp. F158]|uniref:MarR family transcriptional regulator n=1 Tax=Tropicimonas omnivorans TaxID=3075590 RepID=A0ABU3DL71_9RHOB|nr:MarR family transcriptional regulator [Roseicyclus sp. F158]MDT0684455.1 MarR family transcriptional regulator [Roseicyclus sp. F158]
MPMSIPDRTDASLIALRRILRATEIYARDLAQSAELTPSQLRLLQVVSGTPGCSTTPTAISMQMGVSQATITALIDKLAKRDLVRRQQSQTDRRQTNVTITAEGNAVVDNIPDALQQRYVNAFKALEDWEQAQIIASLERVAAMLDAQEIDASPILTAGDISHSAKVR